MLDATRRPQRVLLLGGTSDIALALARNWLKDGPIEVVLAARASESREQAVTELTAAGAAVTAIDFDALAIETHQEIITQVGRKDIDIAVVAFACLADNELAWQDASVATEMVATNYLGAVSVGVGLAKQFKAQGHGIVVALSSVAAERPRRSNFVYGSSKAGFDSFFVGLGEALAPHGAEVLVVRPGFVHTKLTQGLPAAPLATTPEAVATAIVAALSAGKSEIWVPGAFRVVMSGLRHLPKPIFRKLSL